MIKMRRTHLPQLRESQADLATTELRAVRATRAASRRLYSEASRYLRTGLVDTFDTTFMLMFAPALADALLRADLSGRLRMRREAPVELQLSRNPVDRYRRIRPDKVAALLTRYQQQAWQILGDTSTQVEEALRDSIAESIEIGEHVRDAKKRLAGTMNRIGISAVNGYQLETIVRTQTQLAYSAARWAELQDPDIAPILWGFEYNAVMDNRTRDEHAILDGVRLPKDHPFWNTFYPPNGYNCRCVAIPIFSPEPLVYPRAEPIADKTYNFNPGLQLAGII